MNIPDALMISDAGVLVIASIMTAIVAFIVKREIRRYPKNRSEINQHPNYRFIIATNTAKHCRKL